MRVKTNGHSNNICYLSDEFDAYDSLPASIRKAIAELPEKISAMHIKSYIDSKGWTEADLLWSLGEHAKNLATRPRPA